jgi:superfamily II DNA or RNA helicase
VKAQRSGRVLREKKRFRLFSTTSHGDGQREEWDESDNVGDDERQTKRSRELEEKEAATREEREVVLNSRFWEQLLVTKSC